MTSWSTAKSFTSMLIGIAIEKGFITSTEQLASDFITEWQVDDRINITIEQLLDMRSGLFLCAFYRVPATLESVRIKAMRRPAGTSSFNQTK